MLKTEHPDLRFSPGPPGFAFSDPGTKAPATHRKRISGSPTRPASIRARGGKGGVSFKEARGELTDLRYMAHVHIYIHTLLFPMYTNINIDI